MILEKWKLLEYIGVIYGLYKDNGIQNGNYYSILGSFMV